MARTYRPRTAKQANRPTYRLIVLPCILIVLPAFGGCVEEAICTNTCEWARDGECDDGGEGSDYSVCDYGTDCSDCGSRPVNGTEQVGRCGPEIDQCASSRDHCWSVSRPEFYPSCVRTYCNCVNGAGCLGEAGFNSLDQCRSVW